MLRRSLFIIAPFVLGLCEGGALAQSSGPAPAPSASRAAPKAGASKARSHSVPGSPLDTLRSTHLWTDTAPPKDFVKESRPDPKTLDYAPLTGADPDRPKPRDAANVLALQAQLEQARALNEGKGHPKAARARKAAK